MAPPDQGSGALPPAAAALRRQMSCSSSSPRDDPPVQLERRLSCSSASFSSSASTAYHPAVSTKSSCESIPFADAELATSSSASSYASGFFHLDEPDHYDLERPTRAPAVQAMLAAAPYDPKRLPSSMFRTRSTNPAEWSVASNESLFSIRLSNSGDMGDLYYDAAGFPRFPSMGSSDTSSMVVRMPSSVSDGGTSGLCLREDCARCSGAAATRKSVRFAATTESVSGGSKHCAAGSPAVCRLTNAQDSAAARTPETTASGWCQFGCCWPSLPTLWWPRCCAWHCHCCHRRC